MNEMIHVPSPKVNPAETPQAAAPPDATDPKIAAVPAVTAEAAVTIARELPALPESGDGCAASEKSGLPAENGAH